MTGCVYNHPMGKVHRPTGQGAYMRLSHVFCFYSMDIWERSLQFLTAAVFASLILYSWIRFMVLPTTVPFLRALFQTWWVLHDIVPLLAADTVNAPLDFTSSILTGTYQIVTKMI